MAESKQGNSAIAVGALGSVGAAQQVVQQAQDANDLFGTVMDLIKNPNFLIMVAIVGLGAQVVPLSTPSVHPCYPEISPVSWSFPWIVKPVKT